MNDLCICDADIILLKGAQLISYERKQKLNLPFRGSEFRIISHFNSIIPLKDKILSLVV